MTRTGKTATTPDYSYPKTLSQLNQLLADLAQLKNNVQQIHWYMRGHNFFSLHPLMDDYSDQLAEQTDTLGERIIALGGSPFATIKEFVENTGLPDEKITFDEFTLPELVSRLVKQFQYLRDQYQRGIEITDAEGDFPTQDILNGYKSDADKIIWMLSAYLDKGPLD
ncbi:Dps family protein [Liquorilactobacillus satsumensis]|uniref:Ferritin Dps family protein n=1 Tax=Liquorilactobacillus satsumensis DSM 16230 = JCM 12392 TaxID=1423801 RepID=A0A0R1UYW8_9LACO|nr:DNA starvation/stationary phase protection protein [Liquorilactobacillus satsumensis]KRL98511.1 ferritin Dps family protein [Liquorilactobacillus satsumensis DSM 16230 = JCM 12392]MCC7666007.1 DNA starvation/stationary phase protection protein [Liquorilactobacillus satsumensis]MCP9313090.1 DNA starvation/stationary phase protection protein [Liquorilactobacillus satsumensis]MCP9329336.1 DNA starvation/stationary phase protection protein [Liquorilactobacillus satsumensis]MCP9358666.1 DNA star